MTISINELQIAVAAAGIILAALFWVLVAHVAYRGLPAGRAKDCLQKVIYELDRAADNMENDQKRAAAIAALIDLINWKVKIIIPRSVLNYFLGWLIDAEVAFVRKIQRATDTPNLH